MVFKVGDRVSRVIPAKLNRDKKEHVRSGVVVAVERGTVNNGKMANGYRIRFDSDEPNSKPFWYAAKGDFIVEERKPLHVQEGMAKNAGVRRM